MSVETEEPLPEDATQVDIEALFGRSRLLHELTIRFESRADEAQWLKLIQELKFEDSTVGDTRVAAFVALPAKHQQFSPYLLGEVSLRSDQPGIADWSFEWARAPAAQPPEDMLARSGSVGGFPMILDRLEALWPTPTPVEAEVSASYAIDLSRWNLSLPHEGTELQRGGQRFRVIPTHWQLEPASGPVREIITSPPRDGVLSLMGKGTYTLRWTARFLNEVDGAVWGGLKNIFESR
jgi:hypothetical protein